ncbi:MAG: two-component regulator propeller domain-containing protein [bacterium]
MSRQRNTCLFLLIISIFLLIFASHPEVEATDYLNICTMSGSQISPASVWNKEQAEYLTVWQSGQNTDPNRSICGLRLDPSGGITGGSSTPYIISPIRGGDLYYPSVACNPAKNQYLVTWHDKDADNPSSTKIYASLVSFDGNGKITKNLISAIHTVKGNPSFPKAAWNGEQFLIVWYDYHELTGIAGADIYGTRIDADGTVLDPNSFAICTSTSSQLAPVITGYHRQSAEGGPEERGWLVAWVDERNPSSGKDIYAAVIQQNADGTVSPAESFPVCTVEKDQKSLSVATGPQGFFIVWQDGRLRDTKDNQGNSYGNFILGARISFGGQLLNPARMEIPITRLEPYEGRIPGTQPSVACIQNNYLVVWDYKSTVYGHRVSLEGEILDIDSQTGQPKPVSLSDTAKSASMPSVASGGPDARGLITWVIDAGQSQGKDISGVVYELPPSPQLEWVEGDGGVSPDPGEGGTEFTFKVKYIKAEGGGSQPLAHGVLIDINYNGTYDGNEVFDLANSGNDIYQKKIKILYDGEQTGEKTISYKFYFRDEHNVAQGPPAEDHTFTIGPHNQVPKLSWSAGKGYLQDGVEPDSSEDGITFTFKVKYQDMDGTVPSTHQVWIDLDGSNMFEENEKFSLETEGSVNYAQGAIFQLSKLMRVNRAGLIPYRFVFDDGANVAQGEPAEVHCLVITNTAETCIHSSLNSQAFPDIASLSGGSLVIWEDLRDAELVDKEKHPELYQGSRIYGRFLDKEGALLENQEEIQIGNQSKAKFKPRIAGQGDVYLVVWEDLRNGRVETGGTNPGYLNTDIYGQIIDATDLDRVIEIPIATYSTDTLSSNQNKPAVAAGANNRFLVVWEDSKDIDNTGKNIQGAIVSYDPAYSTAGVIPQDTAANDNFIIYDEDYHEHQTNPAVAWGGSNYLVVWQDYRPEEDGDINSHLYANPVDPNGQVMDGYRPKLQNQILGNPVCTDPNTIQENPAIASDGTNFLVVWENQATVNNFFGKDIYGAIVGPNGSIVKQRFIICTMQGDQTSPRVSWDKATASYLVVWDSQPLYKDAKGDTVAWYDTDIRGLRIDKDGALIGSAATSPGFEICAIQGIQKFPAISGNDLLSQVVWMDNRNISPYSLSLPYSFDIYSTPVKSFLGWLEDEDFMSGVNPVIGGNGKNYTFKINYLDMYGKDPKTSQVWIDLNGDGEYSAQEKYNLTPDTQDSDPLDGRTYSKSISLALSPDSYLGNGRLNYRFYFEDTNFSPAAGSANQTKTIQVNYPRLFWTQGQQGVNPSTGAPGTSFQFSVTYYYQPSDTQKYGPEPGIAQLWIDLNHDGQYQSNEKYNLSQVDSNDQNYMDGKAYSYKFTGNTPGEYNYRFYFEHPEGGQALGEPTKDDQKFTVSGGPSSWTTYTTGNTPNLAGDYITSLAFQQDTLWVGTATGLSRFDEPDTWSIVQVGADPDTARSMITALAVESSSDNLYVGTPSGLKSYNGTSWKEYDKATTDETLDKNYIGALALDEVNRRLWIVVPPTSSGQGSDQTSASESDPNDPSIQATLIQYDIETNTWTSYTKLNTATHAGGGLPGNQIGAISVDSNGDLWVSTAVPGTAEQPGYRGLSRFRVEQKEWTHYSTTVNNEGGTLKTDYIQRINGSDPGFLWISGISTDSADTGGTNGGLYQFDIEDNKWVAHLSKGSPDVNLGSNFINALAVNGSVIWIGTWPPTTDEAAGGVSRYDYNKNTWARFTTSDGLVDNRINAIAVQGSDVWIGTPAGLSRYGTGPGDDKKVDSYFNADNRFAFPDDKGCFISSLANPFNRNSVTRFRALWFFGRIFGVVIIFGAGAAFLSCVRRYSWVERQ